MSLRIIEPTPHGYRRMAELPTTYASLRLQVVDACIVALAERLDLREVAALDRRDLLVIAPRHLPKGEGSRCCQPTRQRPGDSTIRQVSAAGCSRIDQQLRTRRRLAGGAANT